MALIRSIGSLKKINPKITVPIVPIPVQTAYAVPTGKLFNEIDKRKTLKAIAENVKIVGYIFVNPLEYFILTAQAVSKIPAINNINHAIIISLNKFVNVNTKII